MDTQNTYGRTEIIEIRQNDPDTGLPRVTKYIPRDPIQNCVSVSLSKLMTANTWYNIITGVNDRIDFNLATNPAIIYEAILNPGKYSQTDFTVEVARAMNAVATGVITVTYDDATFKYTVTNNKSFQLLFGTGPNNETSAYLELGFELVDTGFALSHTGTNASWLNCGFTLVSSKALAGGRRWGTQFGRDEYNYFKDGVFYIPHNCAGTVLGNGSPFVYEDLHTMLHSDNSFSFQGPRNFSEIDFLLMTCLQRDALPKDINGGVPVFMVLTFHCLKKYK